MKEMQKVSFSSTSEQQPWGQKEFVRGSPVINATKHMVAQERLRFTNASTQEINLSIVRFATKDFHNWSTLRHMVESMAQKQNLVAISVTSRLQIQVV